MTQAVEQANPVANHARLARQLSDGVPWLTALRRSGLERFERTGFPTTRQEEWRFTNVAPIARGTFELGTPAQVPADVVAPFSFAKRAAAELVFVNGHFARGLSRLGDLPDGARVMSLAEAMRSEAELLRRHLGQYAKLEQNPFVALNSGFIQDGAFVHLAAGVELAMPIHLLFLSVANGEATVAHPRNLIVFDEAAKATVVESYASLGDGTHFTNAVTELSAGVKAEIDYCKLQQENLEAFHVATLQARLDRGADLVSHSATLGGKLTRNDLNVILDGEFAHATLNGLVLIGGRQHCDNHTLLRHEKANCPSHELYKHVLDGQATGVFKGKIFVQKDAQKTDAKQTNKSLLLSDDAYMNSQPALEIYADDVKCTHGSTTGPLDEDMMFYLRTRGVPLETARHLLTYAFAADITRRIRVVPVRQRLEDYMAAQHQLPQDLRITDLGSHDEAAR